MLAIMLTALAMPPQAPPLEDRVKILEAKVAAVEARLGMTAVTSQGSNPAFVLPAAKSGGAAQRFTVQGYLITKDAPQDGMLVLGWRENFADTRSPTTPMYVDAKTKITWDGVTKTFAELSALDVKNVYFVATTRAYGQADTLHCYPSWATPNWPTTWTQIPTGKDSLQVEAYNLAPSVKTDDAPTYHYGPTGTPYRIENGAVILSSPATHVSYPGGPFMQPVSEGGSCANGQCSPQRGGFRLFGRRGR